MAFELLGSAVLSGVGLSWVGLGFEVWLELSAVLSGLDD